MKVFAAIISLAATLGIASAGTSHAFGISTFSGKNCDGANHGEIIVQAGQSQCVNYSNAGSYSIDKTGAAQQCGNVQVVKFHGLNCAGNSYQTSSIVTGGAQKCITLDKATNPGSARFSCPG